MVSTVTGGRPAKSPQSATRVMQILESLSHRAGPVSLADISRSLGSPKSSVASLLRALAETGYVVGSDGLWSLGPNAYGLGSALLAARRRLQSSDLIRLGMARLAERTGETVVFAVPDADQAMLTYVDALESQNVVRFSVAVGDRRDLYCTAAGRALLAAWPPDVAQAYLDRVKPKKITAHTVTSKRALAEAVAVARTRGAAQTIDQAADGATGTAAAVYNGSGAVLGALLVAAPSSRAVARGDELLDIVRTEAEAVSRSLGYHPSA